MAKILEGQKMNDFKLTGSPSKTRNTGTRIRPLFIALLICVLAAVLIPVWIFTRSTAVVKASSPVLPPAPEAKVAAPAKVPLSPVAWRREMPLPRGTAVSKRATAQKSPVPQLPQAPSGRNLEERWGIRVRDAQLTMGNAFLNLRYEVVNPRKAEMLASGNTRAYVLDRATRTKFYMLPPPKEGAFPVTGDRLTTNKTFFAMVGNRRGILKSGGIVNIVVGDAVLPDVAIE
jgi:hypothetical protein